mmetsp:Transcript_81433/g.161673  ORF Transcript_81433/g.161673 Transcript_81433/m.161673 type:complete len:311 (-) Transcript_81433:15-947(-)
MLDHFLQDASSSSHACLVLEVMGPSVYELGRRCRGDKLPHGIVLAIARDTLQGLDFLHRGCQIIHGDVKPENILLTRLGGAARPQQGHKRARIAPPSCARRRRLTSQEVLFGTSGLPPRFGLADLGAACFVDRKDTHNIQTREYKAPEVLLRAGCGCAADLWALACTLFESATGRYLLDPRRAHARPQRLQLADAAIQAMAPYVPRGTGALSLDEEHLAQVVELTGYLPDALLRCGRLTSLYLVKRPFTGWVLRQANLALVSLARCNLQTRLEEHLESVTEVAKLDNLLEPMLRPEPDARPSAQELLQNR